MDRQKIIANLKKHDAELRAMGVVQLSLFGSAARGEAGPSSDVDLAATFAEDAHLTALDFVGVMQRIEQILGQPIDLVSEPARKMRLQAAIDRDRVRVF